MHSKTYAQLRQVNTNGLGREPDQSNTGTKNRPYTTFKGYEAGKLIIQLSKDIRRYPTVTSTTATEHELRWRRDTAAAG